MPGTAFVDQLKAKFGRKIAGANFDNIDPWIEVTPDGLLEVVATYAMSRRWHLTI